jgi:parallel beta-helix repeat protein
VVEHCAVGSADLRFDFPVVIANGKGTGPDGNRVAHSQLFARGSGVIVIKSDENVIEDNDISYVDGIGITLIGNSDRNRVSENRLANLDAAPRFVRELPGIPASFPASGGVAIFNTSGSDRRAVMSLVVAGRLFQTPSPDGSGDFVAASGNSYGANDDNLIEGNQLALPGSSIGKNHTGIISNIALRTIIRDNEVHQASEGIRMAGGMPANATPIAQRCVDANNLPTDRYCATQADCFIPGLDVVPIGTCPALASEIVDMQSHGLVVELNRLYGPFNAPPGVNQQMTGITGGNGSRFGIIRNNQIFLTGVESGIILQGASVEGCTVTDNKVVGARNALLLNRTSNFYMFFGAQVARNDFIGSTSFAVATAGPPYPFMTELSVGDFGNYWGHDSPPCFQPSDSVNPSLIHDSNAACTPFQP